MHKCVVKDCKHSTKNGVRLFQFPRDENRRQIWSAKCGRNSTPHSRICEYHFDDSQFESNRKDNWRKLKPNAIPTVFSKDENSLEIIVNSDLLMDEPRALLSNESIDKHLHDHIDDDEEEFSSLPKHEQLTSVEDATEATEIPKNTQKYNFENLCRTCSCEAGDLQSLFAEGQIRVADMLIEITDLKIMEGDPLPQKICSYCLEKLKDAYSFIKQCHNIRTQYEDYLNNSIDQSSIVDQLPSTRNDAAMNDIEMLQEFILHVDSDLESTEDIKNGKENEEKPKKKVSKRRLHECPICSVKRKDLKVHMRSHTKEKPFKCEFCDMEFSMRSNCLRHIKIHLNDRPHVCEICNRAFTIRHKLMTHMKSHSTPETSFKCKLCGESFKNLSQLKIHTTIQHHENQQYAEILASIDNDIQQNRNETQRNYLCNLCGKSYLRKQVLEGHLRTHTGEKPYSCSLCDKTFFTSSLLWLHRKTHGDEKPYKCSYCDKYFRCKQLCRRHEFIHTGEKRLKCDLCGKCFRQSSHLYRHRRTHTGEKPFACTICDKDFIVRDQLNTHIRISHHPFAIEKS